MIIGASRPPQTLTVLTGQAITFARQAEAPLYSGRKLPPQTAAEWPLPLVAARRANAPPIPLESGVLTLDISGGLPSLSSMNHEASMLDDQTGHTGPKTPPISCYQVKLTC